MRTPTRPVSIAHLVFGLIFLGAAALWAIGAATDADAPDLALMAPIILIGAGTIGLIAMVVNARRRDPVLEPVHQPVAAPAASQTDHLDQENPS